MRETKFIEQNKEKWRLFERILNAKRKDPDQLSDLFVEITDDLSFSQTYYPNRSVRVYLNYLAQKVFHTIYKNRKFKWSSFTQFWTDELPQLLFEARRDLLLSFLIFSLSMTIGIVSTLMNPEFPRVILGDMYVEMTLENIENGDPMAVYKDDNELISFLWITQNNLRVAFLTFVNGVFYMIGSVGILLYNGIMVGAFQTFFALQDSRVFQESVLTIWMHGTFEISAIILAGAAGLTLGRGLVFPGTYSRLQAFQLSARRGIRLMLGITPIFVIAGFIEGFITRHTETSDFIRLFFIVSCLAFVLIYYVWYPYHKAQRGFLLDATQIRFTPPAPTPFVPYQTRTNSEIFIDGFSIYRQNFPSFLKFALIISTIYTTFIFVQFGLNLTEAFHFRYWSIFNYPTWGVHFENIEELFNYTQKPILILFNTLLFTSLTTYAFYLFPKNTPPTSTRQPLKLTLLFLKTAILLLLFQWATNRFSLLGIALATLPLLTLCFATLHLESQGIQFKIFRTFILLQNGWLQHFLLGVALYFTMILFSIITYSDIVWYLLEILGWNFMSRDFANQTFLYGAVIFIFILGFSLAALLWNCIFGILQCALTEIQDAPSLRQQLDSLGKKQRIYGLEKESKNN